jgi:hypothetical protein
VHTTEELRLLRDIAAAQRAIRGSSKEDSEERAAHQAKGTRDLGSTDTNTDSDSEKDSYESDSGTTEASASTSSGATPSDSASATSSSSSSREHYKPRNKRGGKQKKIRKAERKGLPDRRVQASSLRPLTAASPAFTEEQVARDLATCKDPNEVTELRAELKNVAQQFLQMEGMIAKLISQQQQSQPSLTLPSSPAVNSRLSSGRDHNDDEMHGNGEGDVQTFQAMAGWPEMPLEEVGHASKFEPWKKKYDEYVSKAIDKTRTPATMAQAFHKLAYWFATTFTEQERHRQEQDSTSPASLVTFTSSAVLAMTNQEFTKRYLSFCQIRVKDPSQVLQLLRTPRVDASAAGLTEVMQAAQAFQEQLQLIPKSALQQCTEHQIRDSFLCSIFGEETLRERKADYLQCHTWKEASQLMIRKASGASATAFSPFKALKTLASREKEERERPRTSVDKESRTELTSRDKPKSKASDKPDMSAKAEQKWKGKFDDLATMKGIRNPRHAFASSWKIRYGYLLDCISQGGKCPRCRRKGHLPSECEDPLPEVPYPKLSEEQLEQLQDLTLVSYDDEGELVQKKREHSDRRSSRREDDSPPRRRDSDSKRHDSPSRHRDRDQSDRGRDHGRYQRDYSREREPRHYDRGREDDRRYRSFSREREHQRDFSREREGPRSYSREREGFNSRSDRDSVSKTPALRHSSSSADDKCYRCCRPGHRANECRADTDVNGSPLAAARSQSSPSPSGRQSGSAASHTPNRQAK